MGHRGQALGDTTALVTRDIYSALGTVHSRLCTHEGVFAMVIFIY